MQLVLALIQKGSYVPQIKVRSARSTPLSNPPRYLTYHYPVGMYWSIRVSPQVPSCTHTQHGDMHLLALFSKEDKARAALAVHNSSAANQPPRMLPLPPRHIFPACYLKGHPGHRGRSVGENYNHPREHHTDIFRPTLIVRRLCVPACANRVSSILDLEVPARGTSYAQALDLAVGR